MRSYMNEYMNKDGTSILLRAIYDKIDRLALRNCDQENQYKLGIRVQ